VPLISLRRQGQEQGGCVWYNVKMLRFARLGLLLSGLLSGLLGAVRITAGTQPSPLALLIASADGTPCERPCLFGIEPGKTTRKEVLPLLRAHPLLGSQIRQLPQDDGEVILSAEGRDLFAGKTISVRIAGYPHVSVITLSAATLPQPDVRGTGQPLTSLGEMVAFLGRPDWFVRGNYGGDWYYFRQHEIYALTSGGPQIEMDGEWLLARSPQDNIVSLSVSEMGFPEDLGFTWCGFVIRPHPVESGCHASRP
jgi:hypothetical protein